MSEAAAKAPISVTIKAHKGYEASWTTIHGNAATIRSNVMEFFGITEDMVQGLPAAQVVSMAEDIFKGDAAVAGQLGAKTVSLETSAGKTGPGASAWGSEPPAWNGVDNAAPAQAEEDPKEQKVNHLLEQLATAESIDKLKQLWAKNKDLFSDERVVGAYKARGNALKG